MKTKTKSSKGKKTKPEFTIANAKVVVTIQAPNGETTQLVGPGGVTFNQLREGLEAQGCAILNVVPFDHEGRRGTPVKVSGFLLGEEITGEQRSCDNCEADATHLTRIRVPNSDLACPCDACGRILVCDTCFGSRDRGRHLQAPGMYQGAKYQRSAA